jgi:hypothetical protein
VQLQGALDDLYCPVYAGAKTARLGQQYFHDSAFLSGCATWRQHRATAGMPIAACRQQPCAYSMPITETVSRIGRPASG